MKFAKWYVMHMLRLGLSSIWRSLFTSWIIIVLVFLFQMALILMLSLQAGSASLGAALGRRVDLTVSFVPTVNPEHVVELKNAIAQLPEVSAVRVVSANDIADNFRDRHAQDYITLRALDELNGNPFGPQLHIQTHQEGQYEYLTKWVTQDGPVASAVRESVEFINTVDTQPILERIHQLESSIATISQVLVICAVIVAVVFLIFVTRFTLSKMREEIALMQTLGASYSRVAGQLCMSYAILVVIATMISLVGGFGVLSVIDGFLNSFIPGMDLITWYAGNFVWIALLLLAIGLFVTHLVVASTISLRQYRIVGI